MNVCCSKADQRRNGQVGKKPEKRRKKKPTGINEKERMREIGG